MEKRGDSWVGKQCAQSQPDGHPSFNIFKIDGVDLTKY